MLYLELNLSFQDFFSQFSGNPRIVANAYHSCGALFLILKNTTILLHDLISISIIMRFEKPPQNYMICGGMLKKEVLKNNALCIHHLSLFLKTQFLIYVLPAYKAHGRAISLYPNFFPVFDDDVFIVANPDDA